MRATLSYPYVGERFPEIDGEVVIVKDIANRAEIPYILLKNRMNMKARRTQSTKRVFITDSDLEPKKRARKVQKVSREDQMQALNCEFLRKPLL